MALNVAGTLERRQSGDRLGNHGAVGRRRDFGPAKPIGQGDDAERKRNRAEDLGAPPMAPAPQPQPDDFGRTPADIEHDRVGNARIEQRSAAGDNEPRLLGARDDFDLDPDLRSHPGEKRLAIGRLAARLGGDIAAGSNSAGCNLIGANLERVESACHRIF